MVGKPAMKIKRRLPHTAFFLSNLKSSVAVMTTGSKYPIADDRAAKNINKKNMVPKRLPIGSLSNRLDMVMKSKDGPASGSSPRANIAGNITVPAIRAAMVSKTTIIRPSDGILLSFFR